jgi:inhibitor of KinA sporulation pathway (predicted exonuclease)
LSNNLKKIFSSANTVLIYDLEFTSWLGSIQRNWTLPEEAREVIQIGAVVIDTLGNMREIDSFQTLVRPLKNPVLSEYIVNLTGITQENVERDGVLFPLALSRFVKFIEEYSANISSNGRDDTVIEENCKIHNMPVPHIFTKSINLKPYFSDILGVPQSKCISGMLPDLVGLNNYEKPHDALGDARSIFQTIKYLRMKEQA